MRRELEGTGVTFCPACPGGVPHVVHLPRPPLLPVTCAFACLLACWGASAHLLRVTAGQRPDLEGSGTSLGEEMWDFLPRCSFWLAGRVPCFRDSGHVPVGFSVPAFIPGALLVVLRDVLERSLMV